MTMEVPTFNPQQIAQLTKAFHQGAAEASEALARWVNATITVSIDSVDQCPLDVAIRVLGEGDTGVCMCLMEMQGSLTGYMLLAFDDVSGWALSDLLLGRPARSTVEWGDVENSCMLETMNIAGSSYLNGISNDLTVRGRLQVELIPSPPTFLRDFAESLLQTAFMDQAIASSNVVFAQTRFNLRGQALRWTFLLIPDHASLQRLSVILANLRDQ